MSGRLRNKICIVTGGARGIGAAIVRTFAAEGAALAIWDVRVEEGQKIAYELEGNGSKVVFSKCDVTVSSDIDAAINELTSSLGKPNVLVNNAGISITGTVEEISEEDWDRQYRVNVKSMYLVSGRVIPLMRELGGGSIINMGSESAFVGFPMHPAYTSSKAAVVHLTRSMAIQYAPEKIRVNSLCPGTIQTELLDEFLAKQPDPDGVKKYIEDLHPLGIGTPEDVAWAAVYMASDESKYMTGAPLLVEGGITAI